MISGEINQELRAARADLEEHMKYIREEQEKQYASTSEKMIKLSECSEQALTKLSESLEEQNKLQSIIITLQSKLSEANSTISSLHQVNTDAVNRENTLKRNLSTSKGHVEKLEGDVKSRDSKIVKSNAEITDLKFNAKILEGQLSDSRSHISDLDLLLKKKKIK